MKNKIEIAHHNRTIAGTLFLPDGDSTLKNTNGEYPVAIISHGFNGSEDDFASLAEVIAERGFAAVTYDFCGGSNRSKSSMSTTCMSIDTELEDLRAVIDYVQDNDLFDNARLFLFGESQGGFVSALTAEKYADEIKAVALLYPALCIPDDQNRDFPIDDEIPDVVDFWGVKLGKCYFTVAKKIDVYKKIGSYEKPILFMHGSVDKVVNVDYSKRAVPLYKNAVLEIYPGEDHGFGPEAAPRMRKMTADFFCGNL